MGCHTVTPGRKVYAMVVFYAEPRYRRSHPFSSAFTSASSTVATVTQSSQFVYSQEQRGIAPFDSAYGYLLEWKDGDFLFLENVVRKREVLPLSY